MFIVEKSNNMLFLGSRCLPSCALWPISKLHIIPLCIPLEKWGFWCNVFWNLSTTRFKLSCLERNISGKCRIRSNIQPYFLNLDLFWSGLSMALRPSRVAFCSRKECFNLSSLFGATNLLLEKAIISMSMSISNLLSFTQDYEIFFSQLHKCQMMA